MPSPPCVFVYGTLMPGERNAGVLGAYLAAVTARLPGHQLYDLRPEGYPAVVPAGSASGVQGYLVTYSPGGWQAALPGLDQLEGLDETPPLYRRAAVEVHTSAGPAACWTYLYSRPERLQQPGSQLVAGGDWRAVPARWAAEVGRP